MNIMHCYKYLIIFYINFKCNAILLDNKMKKIKEKYINNEKSYIVVMIRFNSGLLI